MKNVMDFSSEVERQKSDKLNCDVREFDSHGEHQLLDDAIFSVIAKKFSSFKHQMLKDVNSFLLKAEFKADEIKTGLTYLQKEEIKAHCMDYLRRDCPTLRQLEECKLLFLPVTIGMQNIYDELKKEIGSLKQELDDLKQKFDKL